MKSVVEVCDAASGSLIDLSDARVQDDALSREGVVLAAIERQQGQEEEEEGEGKERHEFDMEHDDDVDWEICAAASPAPPLESLSGCATICRTRKGYKSAYLHTTFSIRTCTVHRQRRWACI